jgi:hypothetical protein
MCKLAGIAAVSVLIGSGVASAQTGHADPFSSTLAKEISQAHWAQPQGAARVMNSRLKLDRMGGFTLDGEVASRRSSVAVQSSGRERAWGWKVVGGAIGAVGGLFAGGMLGAALEPDCHCDDPGLKGALIGAPIGAVAGAIVGVILF